MCVWQERAFRAGECAGKAQHSRSSEAEAQRQGAWKGSVKEEVGLDGWKEGLPNLGKDTEEFWTQTSEDSLGSLAFIPSVKG